MWPCGIITFLSELYVVESKTQVYGALHDYMQKNTAHFSHLHTLKTPLSFEAT